VLSYGIIIGALAGVLYGLGEGGVLRNWRGRGAEPTPAALRLFLALGLAATAAAQAETDRGFLLVALCSVGAAKLADLATRTLIDAVRWLGDQRR
jgi:hypothetical protein